MLMTSDEPEVEVEEVEESELSLFDFLVEDKAPTDDVCANCKKFKVGNQVCGIYKCYNDFIESKGGDPIENVFGCNQFKD